MGLSSTKIAPVLDVNCLNAANAASEVYPPLDTTTVNANDVGAGEQILRNQTHTLNELKASLSGATFTGAVTISPSTAVAGLVVSAGPASGQTAIQGTGNGAGQGAVFAGGTTGAGGTAQAGGGNNFGWRGIGSGNETGGEFTGGTTGTGVKATPGTAATTTAPTYAIDAVSGGIRMTTVAAPNASVNPGADATIFPQGIVSSTAIIESDGAGNYAVRNNKGVNIASWSGNSSGVGNITFVRNLIGNDYRIHLDIGGDYRVTWNGTQNVSGYGFVVKNAYANTTVDLSTVAVTISATTIGF